MRGFQGLRDGLTAPSHPALGRPKTFKGMHRGLSGASLRVA